jgi:hypothetical protein
VPLDLLEPRGVNDGRGANAQPQDVPGESPATLLAVVDRYGRKELLSDASIAWVLAEIKWNMFARETFWYRFILHLSIIVLHFFNLYWPVFRDLFLPSASERGVLEEGVCLLVELVLFVLASCKLALEAKELTRRTWRRYFKVGGARLIENVGSLVGCFIYVFGLLLSWLPRLPCFLDCHGFVPDFICSPEFEKTHKILTTISLFSYTLFFILGYQKTGPLVVMFWHMLIEDVKNFMLVYVVVFLCVGSALFLLLDLEDRSGDSLIGLLQALVTHTQGK